MGREYGTHGTDKIFAQNFGRKRILDRMKPTCEPRAKNYLKERG
jgi:hypothetical protein